MNLLLNAPETTTIAQTIYNEVRGEGLATTTVAPPLIRPHDSAINQARSMGCSRKNAEAWARMLLHSGRGYDSTTVNWRDLASCLQGQLDEVLGVSTGTSTNMSTLYSSNSTNSTNPQRAEDKPDPLHHPLAIPAAAARQQAEAKSNDTPRILSHDNLDFLRNHLAKLTQRGSGQPFYPDDEVRPPSSVSFPYDSVSFVLFLLPPAPPLRLPTHAPWRRH